MANSVVPHHFGIFKDNKKLVDDYEALAQELLTFFDFRSFHNMAIICPRYYEKCMKILNAFAQACYMLFELNGRSITPQERILFRLR